MKLYFSPSACSLAPHIVLQELGLPFEAVKVDLRKKLTASGEDFNAINPKGYVPALRLDDGSVLTECAAILQYLADLQPSTGLAPANGSMARYRVQEWLAFLNSEVHKAFTPFFDPATGADEKQRAGERLAKRFDYLQQALGEGPALDGARFGIADAYLYTLLGWTAFVGIDLGRWPGLKAWQARIAQRPAVLKAHAAEKG